MSNSPTPSGLWQLALHLVVWLLFGLAGTVVPCVVRFGMFAVLQEGATFRDIFGYSLIVMIAFGIFLSAMADLLNDGNAARVGGWWVIIAVAICLTIFLAVGLGAVIDAVRDMDKPIYIKLDFWIWGECGAIIFLTWFSGGVKARIWYLDAMDETK